MKTKKLILMAALLMAGCNGTFAQGSLTVRNKAPLNWSLRGPVKEMELQELLEFEDGEIIYALTAL